MTLSDFEDHLATIVAFITALGWLFRLEALSRANARSLTMLEQSLEKAVHDIRAQRREDLGAISKSQDETRELIAEVRSDVKQLLARQGK